MAPVPQQVEIKSVLQRQPCLLENVVDFNVTMNHASNTSDNITNTLQHVLNTVGGMSEDHFEDYLTESTNFTDIFTNSSSLGTDKDGNTYSDEEMRKLNEFHIIKAVVLSIVTLVILLSICKMVFGMILKYPGKSDK